VGVVGVGSLHGRNGKGDRQWAIAVGRQFVGAYHLCTRGYVSIFVGSWSVGNGQSPGFIHAQEGDVSMFVGVAVDRQWAITLVHLCTKVVVHPCNGRTYLCTKMREKYL
jgi:hypothetical protein